VLLLICIREGGNIKKMLSKSMRERWLKNRKMLHDAEPEEGTSIKEQ